MRSIAGVTEPDAFKPAGEEPAFGPTFWKKQQTYKCGVVWALAQMGLSVLVSILITKQKNFDWETRESSRKSKKVKTN